MGPIVIVVIILGVVAFEALGRTSRPTDLDDDAVDLGTTDVRSVSALQPVLSDHDGDRMPRLVPLFEGTYAQALVAQSFFQCSGCAVFTFGMEYARQLKWISNEGVTLYVAEAEYEDATAILVFAGVLDGVRRLNASAMLLRCNVGDLLDDAARDETRRSLLLLRHEGFRQWATFQAMFIVSIALITIGSAFDELAALLFLTSLISVNALGLSRIASSLASEKSLWRRVRAAAVPRGEKVLELAERNECEYALFLRNFQVFRLLSAVQSAQDPYEQRIVEACRFGASMPVVALSDPATADVPVVGACKFAARPDEEWLPLFERVLDHASIILVHLTALTDGIVQEIHVIRHKGMLSRTIVVAGTVQEAHLRAFVECAAREVAVLGEDVFGQGELSEFIDAVEDIRNRTRIEALPHH